eukprot:jgi/Ulvmu1/4354/UM002_0079.1
MYLSLHYVGNKSICMGGRYRCSSWRGLRSEDRLAGTGIVPRAEVRGRPAPARSARIVKALTHTVAQAKVMVIYPQLLHRITSQNYWVTARNGRCRSIKSASLVQWAADDSVSTAS